MALVRKYGKLDIFLTMTCNPNWEEIKCELEFGQIPQDRPNLAMRVFRAKLEEMKRLLLEEGILGKVQAYVYVVEFQKRDLPRAHFLLIMQGKYKLTCPEQYDSIISAELPNKCKYPELYKMVIKHMMRGPCGMLNPECPCTKASGKCRNHYPRPFNMATLQGKDSYPVYRRREDGRKEKVRGHELDNRWVVSYNPFLLRYFNCHINIKVCSSIKAVKYLYKYLYKGHDRASVSVNEADGQGNDDVIKMYKEARIYDFDLSKNSPPVMQLQLHLPGMRMEILDREGVEKSMLTKYFETNKKNPEARGILYRDFPEYFTWQKCKKEKFWQKRKREGVKQIGRIISAHPAEGERYFLRVLLNHVAGATSFEDLRTVDGEILPSFREAAKRRGLIEADNTLDDCLTEAETFQMPSALRRLFATILVHCEASNVRGLWDKHREAMSEDYCLTRLSVQAVQNMVLIDIRNMLQSMGKDIRSYPLSDIDEEHDSSHGSGTAKLLKKASLIIWDEATMTRRQAVEALDNSMRDIMNAPDRPFGGKTIVFGGDFRKGSRAQIVDASLRRSYLWESMRHLKLVRNMRAQSDPWFAECLLRVGNGTEEDDGHGCIRLPDEICVPYTGEDIDLHRLIEDVFPMLDDNMMDPDYITSRAILSTRNDCVDKINMRIIHRF
ncbi:hypothetical protein U9M48_030106 [Paspalum notatum var. saurae]|uniref:ATP-dependent DNA helicase n=1 Tax=Paspalum notatum var. saurae TaxID=547442 RepID=A0AAQ3U2B3_PASNO